MTLAEQVASIQPDKEFGPEDLAELMDKIINGFETAMTLRPAQLPWYHPKVQQEAAAKLAELSQQYKRDTGGL